MRHTNDKDCPSCREKLFCTHPILRQWFRNIKAFWPDAHISWSYRSEDDQNKAVEEGKSKLQWPHSAHNATNEDGAPFSRALDIFQQHDGQGIWDREFFIAVDEYNKKTGASIRWGGDFPHLGDYDHFQMPDLN